MMATLGARPAPAPGAAAWRAGWTALALCSLSRVVLGALALLLAFSVLPALVGWQSSVVLSGSMAPTFTPGDLAVVRPVASEQLSPGQVLLVDDPDSAGRLRLHRLVDVQAGGLQLKGDANSGPDGSLIDPSAVHGVVTFGIPLVGRPVVWLAEGRLWPLVGTGAGLLALLALSLAHRRTDDDPPGLPGAARIGGRRRRPVLPGGLRRGTVVTAAVLVTVSLPGAAAFFSDTSASPALTFPVATLWNCPDVGAAANATNYYRLQESAGVIAGNSGTSGAAGNATYSSTGVSYAQSGPNCGTNDAKAVRLNGTAGAIWTTQLVTNPQTFSVQVWFNTTTNRGGKLIGFGNGSNGGMSTQYDRHIYLTDSGKVAFGVYNNGYSAVTSPNSYRDGTWHLATATFSPTTGMRLYVDGSQVGSNAAVTFAENTTGYWRIGYDAIGPNWPGVPTSAWFAGSLAQVSIYNTVLSSSQVTQAWDITR